MICDTYGLQVALTTFFAAELCVNLAAHFSAAFFLDFWSAPLYIYVYIYVYIYIYIYIYIIQESQ